MEVTPDLDTLTIEQLTELGNLVRKAKDKKVMANVRAAISEAKKAPSKIAAAIDRAHQRRLKKLEKEKSPRLL